MTLEQLLQHFRETNSGEIHRELTRLSAIAKEYPTSGTAVFLKRLGEFLETCKSPKLRDVSPKTPT